MIPPKALAAQWQSTRLNSGVQCWCGRVKPLQQDKGRYHGQAPRAAGGKGRNGHQKAPLCSTCLFPPHCCPAASTVGWGQSALLPQAASSALCPGPAVPTMAWDTLGPLLCRVGTHACTHQPSPFSALTKPNNLPEANFSHDAGQEAPELHLPAPGRAGKGGSPGHDLYSAQPIFGKTGCGLQGVDLSHHHIAQQP